MTFTLAVVIAAGLQPLSAQNSCEALLRFGIFDQQATNVEEQRSDWIIGKLCSEQHRSESSFNKSALSLGIPLEEITVGIGGSSKSSDFLSWYSKLCTWNEQSRQDRRDIHLWASQASAVLADTFEKCINQKGFQVWVEEMADPKYFRLRAEFNSPTSSNKVRTSFGFIPAPIKCAPISVRDLTAGITISGAGLNTVCERSNREASVAIGVNASYRPTVGRLEVPPVRVTDIILHSEEATTIGVKAPPSNPLAGYDALTNAYGSRLGSNNQLELVPLPVPGPERSAEWVIDAIVPGQYSLLATYANGSLPGDDRRLNVVVNGKLELRDKFGTRTGGWLPGNRIKDELLGVVPLKAGRNVIRIVGPANRSFPHVHMLRLKRRARDTRTGA
jgi:hypothetical protein